MTHEEKKMPHQHGSAGEAGVDGIRKIVREEIRAALAELDHLLLARTGLVLDHITGRTTDQVGFAFILKPFKD